MVDFLLNIADFALKVGLVAVAIAVVGAFLFSLLRRSSGSELGEISVVHLNAHHRELKRAVRRAVLDDKAFKAEMKKEKAEDKEASGDRKRIYALEFHGDIAATAVSELREQVTVLLGLLRPEDEVVILLESSGGLVHDYGLAAAQLVRLREAGHKLTVCVDKVAASGGYMMAAVADTILAAPFAVLGSVGVMVMMPNFHRLLKKHDVDYLELTAGEYKRTLSPMGEITDKGMAKSLEDLQETHELFKAFVGTYRPDMDLDRIATGEIWYGTRALEMRLVDALQTSDQYFVTHGVDADIYKLDYEVSKSVKEHLAGAFSKAAEATVLRLWARLEERARAR